MTQPDQHGTEDDNDGNPRFGRLLMVLVAAVLVVVAVTFASEAYFT